MSIWNKVLVGLIITVSLVWMMLAAKVLYWNRAVRHNIASLELQTEQEIEKNRRVYLGAQPGEGIPDLEAAVSGSIAGRGRVWDKATPSVADDGTVTLAIAEPAPHQIAQNQTLFAFDWPADGPVRYVGEFKVTAVADAQVTMAPALKRTAEQLESIKTLGAQGHTWSVFEIMPVDSHEIFKGYTLGSEAVAKAPTDEERRALWSARLAERLPNADAQSQSAIVDRLDREIRLDGRAPTPDDGEVPPERLVDGNYERPLSDFATMFHEIERQQTLLRDAIAAHQLELQYIERSAADALEQQKFMEGERQRAQELLALRKRERDAVAKRRQEVVDTLAQVRSDIGRLVAENRRLATELTAISRQMLEQELSAPAPNDQAALLR